tara:strand:+ start:2414 stop:2896 length:483 start_codon:yes stop_codon:yes gene_type:complete
MIRLIKNLWKCFVLGEKAENSQSNEALIARHNNKLSKEWERQTALQEGVDHKEAFKKVSDYSNGVVSDLKITDHALQSAHFNAFKSTLNTRGKRVLNVQGSISYSQLSYMSIETLVQLEGCGIKTAEHIHQSLKNYMDQYDQEMSYINAVTGGDSEFDSL